jgi:nitrogen fixation/metabolism regulation signal transduction histidine kinase
MGDFSVAYNSMTQQLKDSFETINKSRSAARGLLDATQETLFLLDSDATVLAANKTSAQRLQKTPREMVGKNIFSILPDEIRIRNGRTQTGLQLQPRRKNLDNETCFGYLDEYCLRL